MISRDSDNSIINTSTPSWQVHDGADISGKLIELMINRSRLLNISIFAASGGLHARLVYSLSLPTALIGPAGNRML